MAEVVGNKIVVNGSVVGSISEYVDNVRKYVISA